MLYFALNIALFKVFSNWQIGPHKNKATACTHTKNPRFNCQHGFLTNGKTYRGLSRSFFGWFIPEVPQHKERKHEQKDRDDLRRGHHTAEVHAPVNIAAKELENEPQDRVEQRIEPEELAIELSAAPQEHEYAEDD